MENKMNYEQHTNILLPSKLFLQLTTCQATIRMILMKLTILSFTLTCFTPKSMGENNGMMFFYGCSPWMLQQFPTCFFFHTFFNNVITYPYVFHSHIKLLMKLTMLSLTLTCITPMSWGKNNGMMFFYACAPRMLQQFPTCFFFYAFFHIHPQGDG